MLPLHPAKRGSFQRLLEGYRSLHEKFFAKTCKIKKIFQETQSCFLLQRTTTKHHRFSQIDILPGLTSFLIYNFLQLQWGDDKLLLQAAPVKDLPDHCSLVSEPDASCKFITYQHFLYLSRNYPNSFRLTLFSRQLRRGEMSENWRGFRGNGTDMLAHNADLFLQDDPISLPGHSFRQGDQLDDVGKCRLVPVDEEIRMLGGYFGAADTLSLEPEPIKDRRDGNDGKRVRFDDIGKFAPDRLGNRRQGDVLEGAARTGIFDGLEPPSIFDMALDFGPHRSRIPRRGPDQHAGDDLAPDAFEHAVPVCEQAIRRAPRAPFDRPRKPVVGDALLDDQAVVAVVRKQHVRAGTQKQERNIALDGPPHRRFNLPRIPRLEKVPGLAADPVMHA